MGALKEKPSPNLAEQGERWAGIYCTHNNEAGTALSISLSLTKSFQTHGIIYAAQKKQAQSS
jgi:hypothetical protein